MKHRLNALTLMPTAPLPVIARNITIKTTICVNEVGCIRIIAIQVLTKQMYFMPYPCQYIYIYAFKGFISQLH